MFPCLKLNPEESQHIQKHAARFCFYIIRGYCCLRPKISLSSFYQSYSVGNKDERERLLKCGLVHHASLAHLALEAYMLCLVTALYPFCWQNFIIYTYSSGNCLTRQLQMPTELTDNLHISAMLSWNNSEWKLPQNFNSLCIANWLQSSVCRDTAPCWILCRFSLHWTQSSVLRKYQQKG